jgi:hypothetical protein
VPALTYAAVEGAHRCMVKEHNCARQRDTQQSNLVTVFMWLKVGTVAAQAVLVWPIWSQQASPAHSNLLLLISFYYRRSSCAHILYVTE